MKKELFWLIFISILITGLFNSCATVSPGSSNMIYGTWKLNRIVTFNPAGQDASSAIYAPTSSDESSPSGGSKGGSESDGIKRMVKESVAGKDNSNILSRFPEIITVIQLKHDNTGTITSQKEIVSGNWKLDETGKKIILTEPGTNRVIKIDIAKEGDKSLELFNTLPVGTFIIEYRK